MNAFIIVGSLSECEKYFVEYIKLNDFKSHEINIHKDKIGINEVRQLRQSFSYKVNKRLVLFQGELTIEAQNALLKNIEELPQGLTIFLFCKAIDSYIPTVRSRCTIKVLSNDSDDLKKQVANVEDIVLTHNEQKWQLISELEQYVDKNNKDTDVLLCALRNILLSNYNNLNVEESYHRCKESLKLFPLIANNNIQSKIVLEKIFL